MSIFPHFHLQTLPALAPKRFIARDPRQPCSQVCFATKVDDFRERVQVGLLNDVFGFLVVAQDSFAPPDRGSGRGAGRAR